MLDPVDIFMQYHATNQLEKLVFESQWCDAIVHTMGPKSRARMPDDDREFHHAMKRASNIAKTVLRQRYRSHLRTLQIMPFPIRIAARDAIMAFAD